VPLLACPAVAPVGVRSESLQIELWPCRETIDVQEAPWQFGARRAKLAAWVSKRGGKGPVPRRCRDSFRRPRQNIHAFSMQRPIEN
jgi:hypothetical protein